MARIYREDSSYVKGNLPAKAKHRQLQRDHPGWCRRRLVFGVLAQKTGLAPTEIGLMSLLVFAGSAQFIAVSMLSGGAAAIPIILTTFTINLRHLLMSSSLAVHLRHPKDEPIYQKVS